MKIREIESYFDDLYPEKGTFDWDNSGLLVCADREKDVNKIITCLDVTQSVIEMAVDIGAELIVSHHPLIFEPIKNISEDSVIGRKIISLIENGISVISLHTRFDFAKMGLNDRICELLGIELYSDIHPENEENVRIIGEFHESYEPIEIAEIISSVLKIDVRMYSADMRIKKVCICCGAGKSYLDFALNNNVDALITGDISHHCVVDALERGISLFDFGHFSSEKIASEFLKNDLKEAYPNLDVLAYNEDFSGKIIHNYC